MEFIHEAGNWLKENRGPLAKGALVLAPLAIALLSQGNVDASNLPVIGPMVSNLQAGDPIHFPVELGDGFFSNSLEFFINKPLDAMASVGSIGAIIGGVRLLVQAPAMVGRMQASAEQQKTKINATQVLFQIGQMFYSTIVTEATQWARIPILVASTYWISQFAELAPPELSPTLRTLAFISSGITLLSTIEAVNPFA